MRESTVVIANVRPALLGTYGDGGNILVLERRLQWRGIGSEVVTVSLSQPVPGQADLYVLGGGEDAAQVAAVDHLERSPLRRAIESGAHAFGVCAGLQLFGTSFMTFTGDSRDGLGLLDVVTDRLETRAIGEVVCLPDSELGLPTLSGFENHGGRSTLSGDTKPLGRMSAGIGNGDGTGSEGAMRGRVLGTYLHGPVLARNPALADLLLERVLGQSLDPLDLPAHDGLRRDRLGAAGR